MKIIIIGMLLGLLLGCAIPDGFKENCRVEHGIKICNPEQGPFMKDGRDKK